MDDRRQSLNGAGNRSTPPATLVTRDFGLAGQLQSAGMADIARVVAEAEGELRPTRPGEILLLDAASLQGPISPAASELWTGAFDLVVYLRRGNVEPPELPRGIVVADPGGRSGAREGQVIPGEAGGPPVEDGGVAARPKVVALFNPKGGVGKTTLAIALAHRILHRLGLKTGLVDLDVGGGDLGYYLGAIDVPTLMDAAAYGEDITADLLREFVTRHSSGLEVLPAPGRPELVELAVREGIRPTLRCLERLYDVLVVDTPSEGPSELARMMLEDAHLLVCPLSPDPVSYRRLQNVLQTHPRERGARAILNRYAPGSPLSEGDVPSVLGMPCLARVPDLGPTVAAAAVRGRTPLSAEPDSPLGTAMDAVIRDMYGAVPPEDGGIPRWRRWKNRLLAKGAELLDG